MTGQTELKIRPFRQKSERFDNGFPESCSFCQIYVDDDFYRQTLSTDVLAAFLFRTIRFKFTPAQHF